MITLDDFIKVEIRIGTVLEAAKIPEGDRLLRLVFDFGTHHAVHPSGTSSAVHPSGTSSAVHPSAEEIEEDFMPLPELAEKYPGRHVRQIMSAIAQAFLDPSVLVGKQIAVITNLEPRKFRGYESQGMIMATGTPEDGIIFLSPEKPVMPGVKIH